MGKKEKALGALAVSQIRQRGIAFVGEVTGLGMIVSGCGSRSWVLRYTRNGRRRDYGLGGYGYATPARSGRNGA